MDNMLGGQVSYTDTLNVAACQTVLNKVLNLNPPLNVDGQVGPKTRAAVIEFQKKHGLSVDGIIGPQTSRALQWSNSSMNNTQYSFNDMSNMIYQFGEYVIGFLDDYFYTLNKNTDSLIYKIVCFLGGVNNISDSHIFSNLYKILNNTNEETLSKKIEILEEKLKVPSEEENDWNKKYNEARKKRYSKSYNKNNNNDMMNAKIGGKQAYKKRINTIKEEEKIVKEALNQMKNKYEFLNLLENKMEEALDKVVLGKGRILGKLNPILTVVSFIPEIKSAISYLLKGKYKEFWNVIYKATMEFVKDFIASLAAYAAAMYAISIMEAASILIAKSIVAITAVIAIAVFIYFVVKYLLDRIQEHFENEKKIERQLIMYQEQGWVCEAPSI